MRNKQILLAAAFIGTQVFSPLAWGWTKESSSYRLESAWFDATRVYVLYKKKEVEVHYSLSDVHGTILKEAVEQRLVSYSRSELHDGALIEIKGGKAAASVVYEDADFSINTVDAKAVLSGRRVAGAVPVCERPDAASRPVRWGESLFYCGKSYGMPGNVVHAVPDTVLQSMNAGLKSAEQNLGPLGSRGELVFFMARESALSVTRSLAVVSPLKIGTWPINGEDVDWRTIALEHLGEALSVANGVNAYSPNSVVLQGRMGRWSLCRQSRCERIDKLSEGGGFLLVDEQSGEAMALSLPNLTRPKLLVRSVSIGPAAR